MERSVIVNLGTSADGYIAGPGGDMDWLTSRPKPAGFYGMGTFQDSIDTKILGRKTYEMSLRLGATFGSKSRNIVFSRNPRPADAPTGVAFATGDIAAFVAGLKQQPGRNIWLMGGGDLIASFLDARAIDEFIITVMPVFIGDGVPLLAGRHRRTSLELLSTERFEDGVLQQRYRVLD